MPNAETQLAGLFARYEAPLARLAKAVRAKVRARLPGLAEIVYFYERQAALVLSYSPTEHGRDGICSLRVDPDGVKLYFTHGAKLGTADVGGRLLGKGPGVRYVPVGSAAEVGRSDIEALIAASLTLSKVTLSPGAEGALLFRVEDQKRRAAKGRR